MEGFLTFLSLKVSLVLSLGSTGGSIGGITGSITGSITRYTDLQYPSEVLVWSTLRPRSNWKPPNLIFIR